MLVETQHLYGTFVPAGAALKVLFCEPYRSHPL